MSVITDVYQAIFGKDHIQDGSVIDFSEHGRTGGVSTGQGYKLIGIVNETTLIDEPDANTTYIGKVKFGSSTATSSAIWSIKRVTISGAVTTINFADGDTNYDNIWDNRASLSYS